MVNKARVHGELVFVSSTYQCHYIGTWAWRQPQWLKDNPDKWRYLEDVLRRAQHPYRDGTCERGSPPRLAKRVRLSTASDAPT